MNIIFEAFEARFGRRGPSPATVRSAHGIHGGGLS